MINLGNPANLTRVLFGIVLGVAVFMMAQIAVLSAARVVNLDSRYSWLFLLPVALLAGSVAGAASRRWGFTVGAVAAAPMLLIIVAASLAVRVAGGPAPRLDLGVASLMLHLFLGALGGWIGAHKLPAIPVPPMREGRARASTTALLFFIAFVSVIAVLYTTALPRLLLVTVVVAASWAYGAFTWLRAKNTSERWRAVFIAGMGGFLAFTTWQTPEPPPVSPIAAFGLLTGGVLGALLMWRLYVRSEP